jgi:hypothetical protein
MEMIAHQNIAVHAQVKFLSRSPEQLQKLLPVLIVSKDCLSLVPRAK